MSTGGPWQLVDLRFTSDVKAPYAGATWAISASINPSIPDATEHHGVSVILIVQRPEGRTKGGVPGRWRWVQDTKQEMMQAGYELSDPKHAGEVHFRRFVPTLRQATLLKELKRIEGRLTAALD